MGRGLRVCGSPGGVEECRDAEQCCQQREHEPACGGTYQINSDVLGASVSQSVTAYAPGSCVEAALGGGCTGGGLSVRRILVPHHPRLPTCEDPGVHKDARVEKPPGRN